jgi:hypothetical protein
VKVGHRQAIQPGNAPSNDGAFLLFSYCESFPLILFKRHTGATTPLGWD